MLPREPEAFTERVAGSFRKALARARVVITGPLDVEIDGDAVSLRNLYRAALRAEEGGPDAGQQLLDHFIDSYLTAQQLRRTPLPFEVVSSKILPRIAPLEAIAGSSSSNPLACEPFVNDTVILYTVDLSGASVPLTLEQLIRWGVEVAEIDRLARQNLAGHAPRMELRKLPVGGGGGPPAAVFNTGDGYDAARLLLQQLYSQLASDLGATFLVAIPSRDVLMAFPQEPRVMVGRLRRQVESDYRKLPYPITADLFVVTRDGVAGSKDAA